MKHLFLILIILSSCSPLKRHARIVKKFPYVHTVDSIKLIDTVRLKTNSVQIDTVTLLSSLKDTITIVEDNLTVKVYTVKDSFYINAKCDTIYLEKIITNTVPVYRTTKPSFNWNWIYLLIAFIIGVVVIKKLT